MPTDKAIEVEVLRVDPSRSGGALATLPSGAQLTSAGLAFAYETISPAEIEHAIQTISDAVLRALSKARPDSCKVEFSLGFKAGAKVPVLVNGEANATFKVTLDWKGNSKPQG